MPVLARTWGDRKDGTQLLQTCSGNKARRAVKRPMLKNERVPVRGPQTLCGSSRDSGAPHPTGRGTSECQTAVLPAGTH